MKVRRLESASTGGSLNRLSANQRLLPPANALISGSRSISLNRLSANQRLLHRRRYVHVLARGYVSIAFRQINDCYMKDGKSVTRRMFKSQSPFGKSTIVTFSYRSFCRLGIYSVSIAFRQINDCYITCVKQDAISAKVSQSPFGKSTIVTTWLLH